MNPERTETSRALTDRACSMTGYATAQGITQDGTPFTLTFKSVNHRFLDLNMRLPGGCDGLELKLRRLLKENVCRGHVDVTLYVDRRSREGTAALQLNRELLAAHVRTFRDAAALHELSQIPDLHELLRAPGVLSAENAAPGSTEMTLAAALDPVVMALAPGLLAELNEVRAGEGAALVAELRGAMLRLRALAEEAAGLRMGAREAHMQRLRARIAELLGGESNGEASDHRLMAEAAILVERSDVEEELVRLRAHVDTFLELLKAGGELGKRLDFLLQELNREVNTMLSKTTSGDALLGLRLTTIGLEMKTEVERAREQVQNLE